MRYQDNEGSLVVWRVLHREDAVGTEPDIEGIKFFYNYSASGKPWMNFLQVDGTQSLELYVHRTILLTPTLEQNTHLCCDPYRYCNPRFDLNTPTPTTETSSASTSSTTTTVLSTSVTLNAVPADHERSSESRRNPTLYAVIAVLTIVVAALAVGMTTVMVRRNTRHKASQQQVYTNPIAPAADEGSTAGVTPYTELQAVTLTATGEYMEIDGEALTDTDRASEIKSTAPQGYTADYETAHADETAHVNNGTNKAM